MFRGFRGERVVDKGVEKVNKGPNIAEPSEKIEVKLNYEPIRRINTETLRRTDEELSKEVVDILVKDLRRGL